MLKRAFDFCASLIGLIALLPVFTIFLFLVWIQDFHNPFYVAQRMGKNQRPFQMIKIRSMKINADKTGVDSTSSDDNRITKVGYLIRKFKIDELAQLINVLIGDMSFVGPRPNVKRETDLYTKEEKNLLKVRPGITDFSSIVFSDEGDILKGKIDPDIAYNQLIRPGKSKLGIFYVDNRNLFLDFKLIIITIISILSRKIALNLVSKEIQRLGGTQDLVKISLREEDLIPSAPPGAKNIVMNREGRVE